MRNKEESFAATTRERRRPVGVSILAVLMLLAGVLFVITGVAFFFLGFKAGGTGVQAGRFAAVWAGVGAAAGIIFLVFGALHATLAVGLLQLRNLARILTIFLFGISAAGACLGLVAMSLRFSGTALAWNAFLIVADAWVLWYLLRPQIKKAFGA